MIFSALACHLSLDTKQESYDIGNFPVLVKQNIERKLLQLKNGKWQATKLSGPWIRRIA